jgi:hypothetical protein
LREGLFDGAPRLNATGDAVCRRPVRGYGRLVSCGEVAATSPGAVHIGNWEAGAAAFAAAFEKLLAASQSSRPSETQASRQEGRHAATEELLRKYLAQHRAKYEQLVHLVLQGDGGARKQFQDRFGPTAFARWVARDAGHKSTVAEIQRIKTAVDKCPTYLARKDVCEPTDRLDCIAAPRCPPSAATEWAHATEGGTRSRNRKSRL